MGDHGNTLLQLADWQHGRRVEKQECVPIGDNKVAYLWQIGSETAVITARLRPQRLRRFGPIFMGVRIVRASIEGLIKNLNTDNLFHVAA